MKPLLDALTAQNGTYTLETVSPDGRRDYEMIRSISKVVPWTPDLKHLIEMGATPQCKIISFTVTEAGYYLDDNLLLVTTNQDITADLKGERTTIYGTIGAILSERMRNNIGKVTLQTCDNLRNNGDRFKTGMVQFLEQSGQTALKEWMLANTTCPNSMVDRITPRPTPDVRERVLEATGFDDKCPVMSEAFIQWVIEEEFCAGRPAYEKVGAEIVNSVLPYEEAKIRILNATHSLIAWAGTLVRMQFIHEGTQDSEINAMAKAYITEDVIPCLMPSPLDLEKYRDVVLERFSNPYIQDTNQRVAADGFSKIPGFIMATIKGCLDRKAEPMATAVMLAIYFRFLECWHNNTLPYTYQDGVMDPTVAHAFFRAPDPLKAFLAREQLWGSYTNNSDFGRLMRTALAQVDGWIAKRG